MTQLTKQQRYFSGVRHPVFELFGIGLERLADLTGQWQGLQLGDQRIERCADLLNPGFTSLLGVEHGFFKARQQGGKGGVHLIGAHRFAHFFHALVDRAVRALSGQGAAHQATAQQVEAGIPAALKLVLQLHAFKVFLFPARGLVPHAFAPLSGGRSAIWESTPTEPGRRISTATGRWSEIG